MMKLVMKRFPHTAFSFLFLLLLLYLCSPSSALARQKSDTSPLPFLREAHMSLMLNTSFTADAAPGEAMKLAPRMNYLKWELKGRFDEEFSFHFRQSLTKKAVPGEADKAVHSVDYANITWQPSRRFSLMAGKQLLCLGGYEFWVSGYKVKEFTLFNDYMNNYATGATATYRLSPKRSLSLQVVGSKVGSDAETFCYGLPDGVERANVPLLATLNYESFSLNDEWQLRYSLSYGQQAARRSLAYFTSGHVLRHRKLLAYWDVNASYEGVDHKGLVSRSFSPKTDETPSTAQHAWYFSTVMNADYRFSGHWNGYLKGIYECGGIARANGDYQKGVCLHEWQAQACIEYFPKKKLDLKFYLLAQYRQRFTPALAGGTARWKHTARQRLMVGVVYAIPVF